MSDAQPDPDVTRARVRVRALLTYAGAAALAMGPFLVWLRPLHFSGFQLNAQIFYRFYLAARTHVGRHQRGSRPLTSAGLVFLILAALAFAGLTVRRGWLTSVSGALGVVAVGAYILTVTGAHVRHSLTIGQAFGPGAIVTLIGGALAVAAGSFGPLPPRRAAQPAHRPAAGEPPRRPDARSATADEWWERTRRPHEA